MGKNGKVAVSIQEAAGHGSLLIQRQLNIYGQTLSSIIVCEGK